MIEINDTARYEAVVDSIRDKPPPCCLCGKKSAGVLVLPSVTDPDELIPCSMCGLHFRLYEENKLTLEMVGRVIEANATPRAKSMSNWGITEQICGELCRDYMGRVIVDCQDGGPPSNGTIVHYNKRSATVRLGKRETRYRLEQLKAPIEYTNAKKEAPKPMPPEIAPRPTTYRAQPIAQTAAPAQSPPLSMGGNIVVAAAKMEQAAQVAKAKRDGFADVEKEFNAARDIYNAYHADIDKADADVKACERALKEAMGALLVPA